MNSHIDATSTADTAIVSLNGRLTFAENAAFRRVVEGLERQGRHSVVINMAGVEFMDSAGMGLLLVARDVVAGQGGRVTLRDARGQVARMLRLAKFGDFFTLDFECAQV